MRMLCIGLMKAVQNSKSNMEKTEEPPTTEKVKSCARC